jgi:hypothetical protein
MYLQPNKPTRGFIYIYIYIYIYIICRKVNLFNENCIYLIAAMPMGCLLPLSHCNLFDYTAVVLTCINPFYSRRVYWRAIYIIVIERRLNVLPILLDS